MDSGNDAASAVEAFEAIMERSRHPMVVVTADDGSGPAGCLVGFHTRCSTDPARYLVCLSPLNRTHEVASAAGVLAVHELDARHAGLAGRFGEMTGHSSDKFAGVEWHPGPGGVPLLGDVPTWWVGGVLDVVGLGDHDGFVVAPVHAHPGAGIDPLTAYDVRHLEAGHPIE